MDPKFRIFTGLLKAFETDDGKKHLRTTASSTVKDLGGDEIKPEAIEKMAEKANDNLTIFLNHEYRVPEDVLGSVKNATMHTRGVDSEGNPIVDLDFDIALNDTNPRAVQTYDAIKSGTKLGTSIGAVVKDFKKKKGGGLEIHDLDLLEASIVGIPANPRSWVQYAVKSINAVNALANASITQRVLTVSPENTAEYLSGYDTVEGDEVSDSLIKAAMCPTCGKGKSASGCSDSYHDDDDDDDDHKAAQPDLTMDSHPELPDSAFACVDSKGRHYPHHTKSGGLDLGLLRSALSRLGDKSNTQCGAAHIRAHARAAGIGEDNSEKGWIFEIERVEKNGTGHIITQSLDADETKAYELELAANPDHFNVTEAEKEAARTRVTVTVDSDGAQGAPSESTPDKALLDDNGLENEQLLSDTVTRSAEAEPSSADPETPIKLEAAQLEPLTKAVSELLNEVKSLTTEVNEERQKRQEAEENFAAAKAIVEKIAALPLGRKTGFAEAIDNFGQRFPQYDPEVVKFLEKK